jgi:hypothetical protein
MIRGKFYYDNRKIFSNRKYFSDNTSLFSLVYSRQRVSTKMSVTTI